MLKLSGEKVGMSNFVSQNDPILRKVAKKVPVSKVNSKEIKDIIQTMVNISHGQRKNRKRPIMVGLAAPQIGISKRIILVDTKANGKGKVGKIKVYINPKIVWKSKRKGEWYEGCFSTPEVCGIVSRSTSIKIKAQDINGKLIEEKHRGYIARIILHEIDHLNGILFVTHIKNPDHLHKVKPSEFPIYRNKQAWKNWPKKCSFEKWNQIKNPGML